MRKMTEPQMKSLLFQKLLVEAQEFVNKNIVLRDQIIRLVRDEPYSVAQIARILGTNRQTIQKIANRLVAEKLCSYTENYYHKTSRLLRLTGRGGKYLLGKADGFDTLTKQLTYEISVESLGTVIDVLETMNG